MRNELESEQDRRAVGSEIQLKLLRKLKETNSVTLCVCVGVWVCGCVGVWVCVCVGVWVCRCACVWVCGCVGVCVCV